VFVRWKKRDLKCRRRAAGPSGSLYAMVAECYRRDGAPRQRVLAYLAHIRTQYLGVTGHQVHFWRRATRRLDELELAPDVRAGLEAQLERVVHRPTAEELESWQKGEQRLPGTRGSAHGLAELAEG
jgi:hypothetical protein